VSRLLTQEDQEEERPAPAAAPAAAAVPAVPEVAQGAGSQVAGGGSSASLFCPDGPPHLAGILAGLACRSPGWAWSPSSRLPPPPGAPAQVRVPQYVLPYMDM